MIAVDTNVLVRIITRDDPDQARAAIEVFESGPIWVAKTVVLELEWVLRYSYGLDRSKIHEVLTRLLGLRSLTIEDRGSVVRARDRYEQGMDFADALHLASSTDADSFATFDRKLAKATGRLDDTVRVELLGI